jgi:hypothetical protein
LGQERCSSQENGEHLIKTNFFPMKKRPFRVICLAVIVAFYTAWNGLRFGETIFFWKTLGQYGAHPLYIAVSGAAWLCAGLLLVSGLWIGKVWGWVAMFGGTVGYTAWYWFDRLIMQKPHANWPFVLIANIVFLLIIFTILFSRKTRRFFKRDAYEQKPKNPTIT